MNNCSPIYLVNQDELVVETSPPPADEVAGCSAACQCGYIQFEALLPHLAEIRDSLKTKSPEERDELEFKLRTQIVEVSRLFDMEANVRPGYFSKAHYTTTQIVSTNGTRFMRLPLFVNGTLQVRTLDNQVIDPNAYAFRDGYLMFLPCLNVPTGQWRCDCGAPESHVPQAWPDQCYQITARWGYEVADMAVQMAIRDYIVESYRVQDPVVVAATGLPVSRTFKVPYSWSAYLRNFKAKRDLQQRFAIA